VLALVKVNEEIDYLQGIFSVTQILKCVLLDVTVTCTISLRLF